VSPASTLHNWKDEVSQFLPHFRLLPYWGGLNDRKQLRRFLDNRQLYCANASFHVVVTSYQLLVSDEKFFKPIKWQYMILDEAQALKNSGSQRWQSLLSFSCRNRLLLTGTPIQNNMAELWSLLHFIMPTLFDNHAQFSEWFSKGVEGASQGKEDTLSDYQLKRLHAILKPFMLRRVKTEVAVEMVEKHEVNVLCDLSRRQRLMYDALRRKVPIADLMKSGGVLSDRRVMGLLNLVMQLRKVRYAAVSLDRLCSSTDTPTLAPTQP